MAAREHRVSRRVMLGAACALPLTRHPGEGRGPGPQEKGTWTPDQVRDDGKPVLSGVEGWDRNLAAFRRAQAVIEAAVSEPAQDRYDTLLDAFSSSLRRLLRTPAPDLPALVLKIELAIDEAAWESTGGEASMAALKRDAKRLARRSS